MGVSGRQDEEDDSKPLTLSRMMSQIAELVDFPSAEIAIGLDKYMHYFILKQDFPFYTPVLGLGLGKGCDLWLGLGLGIG